MNEKTVLITGATDGIGRATARLLAAEHFTVFVHGRDESKANEVLKEVSDVFPRANHRVFIGDLSSLDQVHRLAEEILEQVGHLDVLVNNAGVYMEKFVRSAEGHEMTFAVNHLSHVLLTYKLLSLVKESRNGRIVSVSSVAHTRSPRLETHQIDDPAYFSPYDAYAFSKLCNVIFSMELSERMDTARVTVNSLHPGVVTTKLLRSAFGISGISVERGAGTSVYLAASGNVQGVSGKYFVEKKEVTPSGLARNEQYRKDIWEFSEKAVGLRLTDFL